MTRVKICGITTIDNAIFSQENGADALGFIFYKKSKRYIQPENVKIIISRLNPFISKVGVFVNSSSAEINEITDFCSLTHIQLHGDETVEFAKTLNRPVIKALNFNDQLPAQLEIWRNYSLLIDSWNKDSRGGTGQTIPWQELKQIIGETKMILAGGLTAENVKEAIKTVKPIAVDVSSGVEKSPGIKEKQLVKQFIESAKQ